MSEPRSYRIDLLDLWRSLCIVCMCLYHFVYDLAVFALIPAGLLASPGFMILRAVVGGSFVLLAGICCRLSRSNIRRALITLAAGCLVMAASLIVRAPVLFGVLQLLGLCMLFYGLLGEKLERLPGLSAPLLYIALFILSLWWTHSVSADANWLFPLGFVNENFFSADYYPLFPWLFLFLLGTWLGGLLPAGFAGPELPAALTWPGKHSLIIYLLHQPLLYALAWLIA